MSDWRARGLRWWRAVLSRLRGQSVRSGPEQDQVERKLLIGKSGANSDPSATAAGAYAEIARTRAVHKILAAGGAAREVGDLPTARARYEEALALSPNHGGAMTGLAEALFLDRAWDALLPVCNQLMAVGTDADARLFGALLKGRALDQHYNRPDKAEETYAVCLAWQPDRPELLLRLAELALRRGEAASALGLIERGLDLPGRESGRGDLLLGRAAALAGLRRADEALDALEEATSAGVQIPVPPWIAVTAPALLSDHLRQQIARPKR